LSAQDTAGETTGGGHGLGEPSEDELRAAYEAELSRITTTDMMAQAAVSLLNLGARRLAPSGAEPGGGGAAGAGGGSAGAGAQRDLEQARDAIDGAKALLEILERRIPQELGPLRDALSRLQMAYAREIQPSAAATGPAQAPDAADERQAPAQPGGADQQAPEPGARPAGPGPAEASGRLWVPGR
jgi:hypothetical protein